MGSVFECAGPPVRGPRTAAFLRRTANRTAGACERFLWRVLISAAWLRCAPDAACRSWRRAAAAAYYGYQQPYYQQPYAQPVVATKDHVAAGLLAIFLGWLGIHKFYLGYNTSGFVMLGVSILGGILTLSLACWVIWVIAIIEGIIYLTKSQSQFEQIYVLNKKEWF